MTTAFIIRAKVDPDDAWIRERLTIEWGSETIIVHGEVFSPATLRGFVADKDGENVGLITYQESKDSLEIITLNSWFEGVGVGTALVQVVRRAAERLGCIKLVLTTTNDNTPALRFYQKLGFRITAIHCAAVTQSRRIKPQIPEHGIDGIPVRDEIVLELRLDLDER